MTETLILTWKDVCESSVLYGPSTAICEICHESLGLLKRRELRVNLRAASADVGVNEALRRLGNIRTMAAEYWLLSTADRDFLDRDHLFLVCSVSTS